MPYITKSRRKAIKKWGKLAATTPGELNYVITSLCKEYLKECDVDYGALNEVVGVLEAVKLEFYRRVLVPYEEEKRLKNGDVY